MLTSHWVQNFMDCHNIVGRSLAGKLMVSSTTQASIEKNAAFHLGILCQECVSSELKEENLENCDETYFVGNMDNGRTLGFKG